jgi:hypothetical protein
MTKLNTIVAYTSHRANANSIVAYLKATGIKARTSKVGDVYGIFVSSAAKAHWAGIQIREMQREGM